MGWASSRPHNSHLTTPTWAAAVSGLVLLNISVLMALFAIGPLDCESSTTTGGGDPRQPQQMDTTLNCDPGVTPEEQSRVARLSVIGISLVLAGFILGTIELATRVVRNGRAHEQPTWGPETRRD
jgi:hypothetical protein